MADPTPEATAPPVPAAAAEAAATNSGLPADDPTPAPSRVRSRLLEVARADNARFAQLADMQSDFNRRGEILGSAVPACYLELVANLRDAVRAFNATLNHAPETPVPVISWQESPNIVLRDPYSGDGMRVRLSRTFSQFELVLRFASRPGKSDIPIIEGFGQFGKEYRRKTLMRIDGWVENGKVVYWYSLDFKRYPIEIAEVPDRIVLSVATNDYKVLSRDLMPPDPKPEEGTEESLE